MIINIGIWTDPMFGDFGDRLRETARTRSSACSSRVRRRPIEGLPAWPDVRDARRRDRARPARIYYLVAAARARGPTSRPTSATGEAVIGVDAAPMTSRPIEEELRGALRDELTRALRRLPGARAPAS